MGIAETAGTGLAELLHSDAAGETGGQVILSVLADVPTPVLVVLVLLVVVLLWFVAVRYLLAICYRVWRRLSRQVYRLLTVVLPESPVVRFAAGTMVLVAAVIVIVGGLPVLVGDLTESDGGAASYADRVSSEALATEWGDVVDGDAVGGEPACDGSVAPVPGDRTDRDGDGLPDAWERAGQTPGGASLPDADPGRKDLYVQLNYGSEVEPLSDAEREQLRDSWASMPVENPSGSTGVALHLESATDGAGDLGEPAVITTLDERNRWYTEAHLGPRRCVYRQVVYGSVDVDGIAGVASTPGYSSVVDGTVASEHEGVVSPRVGVTVHELLHTAVGNVDGRPHTNEGWLQGGADDEFLSSATARDVNETGIYGPTT